MAAVRGGALRAALLLGMAGSGPAAAEAEDDAPWYVGQPVAAVTLEATDGGLPGENLEPLLNLRQGEPYQPWDVRADLAMLHRVGDFAAIEAEVEPWVDYDAAGEPFAAVRVTYRVVPPPRIRRVRASGSHALSRREVVGVAGLASGDPFFREADTQGTVARLRQHLDRMGYPEAKVEVTTGQVDGRRVDVTIAVADGPARRAEKIVVVGAPPHLDHRLRRSLTLTGLWEGRRYTRDLVVKAREGMLEILARRGYPEARVNAVLFPAETNPLDARLTFVVDAGRPVDVDFTGLGWLERRSARTALDLSAGRSLSTESLVEMEERLESHLRNEGYLLADAGVRLEEVPGGRRLDVRVDRGRRYRFKAARFEGAHAFGNRYLQDALLEADPEVLGRRRVTEEAVDHALGILQEFYRSQGFLSAQLQRAGIDPRRRTLFGAVPVVVRVDVEEGARTTLVDVTLEGDLGAGQGILAARRASLVGHPFNPAALEALAREIVDAYRDEGYLDADARATSRLAEGGLEAIAHIDVEPGPRVFLRNLVIQGHRRTRRAVIDREVELVTGEPITAGALEKARSNLYDLGTFRTVDPMLVGDEDRVKDLLLLVEEIPNIGLEVGGALATDEGVQAVVRATHRNLWGRAHRLGFNGQLGLGYEGDRWRLDASQAEWRAAVRYETPELPGTGERLHLDALLNEERQETTYRLTRTGGGPGIQARGQRNVELVLTYRLEWRRLQDVDPGALVPGDPWLPFLGIPSSEVGSWNPEAAGDSGSSTLVDSTFLDSSLVLPTEQARPTSGPEMVVVVDKRDDVQNPRRGARFTFQARLFDSFLTGNAAATGQVNVVELVPVGPFGLLLSAKAGIGQALFRGETLALEDRFRLGGSGSLRGFTTDSVGPMNQVSSYDPGFPSGLDDLVGWTSRDDPNRWVPTGGDTLLALTAEFKVPAPVIGLHKWADAALVTFVDAGNVWFVDPDVTTSSMREASQPLLRVGTGIGLRYATPIGPLQLDLGINPSPMDDRDEPDARVHLSLGTM